MSQTEIGFRYMPTISSFQVYTQDNGRLHGNFSFSNGFGGFLGYNFSEHFGLQAEVIYSDIAQKYRDQNYDRKVTLNYINIPLLLSFNTGKFNPFNFNFSIGPQLGLNVGSRLDTYSEQGTENVDAVLAVKKGDIGFAYGAGFDFGLNSASTIRLGLGFRGVYGLIDISDRSETQVTNSYFVLDRSHVETYSAYAGLSFIFGSKKADQKTTPESEGTNININNSYETPKN
jgi:hypothetical protein